MRRQAVSIDALCKDAPKLFLRCMQEQGNTTITLEAIEKLYKDSKTNRVEIASLRLYTGVSLGRALFAKSSI